MPEQLSPLRSAPFRWLATGSAISTLGDAIAPVALAFAVLDLTGSATKLGIVVAARTVANIAFVLLGGVVADRLPRGMVMVGSTLAATATQSAVAALVITRTDSLLWLVLLSLANGAVSSFAQPAEAALIQQTVDPQQLRRANAQYRLGINAANMLGKVVAGVIVVAFGSGQAIAVDAGTFLLAGACFALVRVPRVRMVERAPSSMFHELKQGWSAFLSRTWLWVVVAAFSVINAAVTGGIFVLGPVIADETFGRREWGFVLAAQALGFVVGGLSAMRLMPRRLLAFGMIVVAAEALPLFALGTNLGFWILFVAAFISGLGTEQFGVAWQTSLHRHVPADLQARVSSYDWLGSLLAIPVGQVAAGPISDALGLRSTLIGAGLLVLLSVAAALASRSVRGLTDEPAIAVAAA